MGFLHGVKQIGMFFEELNAQIVPEELRDLYPFLELPLRMPAPEQPKEQEPQEIRIPLQVKDINAETLNVVGVGNFQLADYCGGGKEEEMCWKYLYADPPGSNTSWKYSPVYRLGKGQASNAPKTNSGSNANTSQLGKEKASNALLKLLGKEGTEAWNQDKNLRFMELDLLIKDNDDDENKDKEPHFYKLYHKMLKDFEEEGCFGRGSAELIMDQLMQRVQELAGLWNETKRSYLLVFGIQDPPDKFLFPGEVRAFKTYFRKKKQASFKVRGDKENRVLNQDRKCALCRASIGENLHGVHEVFPFATFDKKNFLPAGNEDFISKVFPLCERCYTLLKAGKTEVEGKSAISLGKSFANLKVWVVPEVIGKPAFRQLIQDGKSYLKEGVESEERYLDLLARRDASFVYHFLFVEPNQAQLILHRLVEDVPPSHFRKLKNVWQEVKTRFSMDNNEDGTIQKDASLDNAVRMIAALLMNLAGKTDAEKSVMKKNVLNVIASLFQNQAIDLHYYKALAVSRLPGLFSNEDWIKPKNQGAYSGASQLHSLWMLFEFFTLYNQQIEMEGDAL